jgi:hypothetical protein
LAAAPKADCKVLCVGCCSWLCCAIESPFIPYLFQQHWRQRDVANVVATQQLQRKQQDTAQQHDSVCQIFNSEEYQSAAPEHVHPTIAAAAAPAARSAAAAAAAHQIAI